jgi:ribosomal-protein-alanine N-acetyltransferase
MACRDKSVDDRVVDDAGPPMTTTELRTPRLILRRWRESDREPFAQMNADAEVMRYFVRPLTQAESDASVARMTADFDRNDHGQWALEIPGEAPFIGFTGLWRPPYMPVVEVGWRLARSYWGKGYATEAARAAIDDGFERVGLKEIVSFTSPLNQPSIRVMEKLGMTHDAADDFEHPNVPVGHALRFHVMYRLSRTRWSSADK